MCVTACSRLPRILRAADRGCGLALWIASGSVYTACRGSDRFMSDRRLACDGSGVETTLVNSFLSFEMLNVELGHLLLMPDFTKPPLHVKHLHLFLHFIPHLNEGVRVELGGRITVELVEHDVEAPFSASSASLSSRSYRSRMPW